MANLTKKAAFVFRGFSELNDTERKALIDKLNEYLNEKENEQKIMVEKSMMNFGVAIGPIATGGCPCCGS